MGPQEKKSLFRLTSVDCLLAGMIIGFVASNLIGFSYLAAARDMNERVMRTYERELKASLSDMPASAQLVASFASKRAMEASVQENRAGQLWALVISHPDRTGSYVVDGRCGSGMN